MLEDGSVAVDRGGDVPRLQVVGVALRSLGDLVGGEELGGDLPRIPIAEGGVGQVVAALVEHPGHSCRSRLGSYRAESCATSEESKRCRS